MMMDKSGKLPWTSSGAPFNALSYIRAGLLLSPFLLLLWASLSSGDSLGLLTQVIGGIALLILPGYLLLRVLGADPLDIDAPGYRWPLVVPLSISVNVIMGIILVLTPIGLSAVSLWASLSLFTILGILISKVRGL